MKPIHTLDWGIAIRAGDSLPKTACMPRDASTVVTGRAGRNPPAAVDLGSQVDSSPARLLTVIVTSSRELIEAEDFEAGVLAWLEHFGRSTDAIRASLYDFVVHEESGLKTWRMLAEWVREGIENNVACSFAEPYVLDPRGDEDVIADWMSKDFVVAHVDELSGRLHELLKQQGHQTSVGLPFRVKGIPWGAVSLDFFRRREPTAEDRDVLRIAADTFATVLTNRQANEENLLEREARLAAAERDNRELRRRQALLEAVSHTSRAFLQTPDYLAVLPEAFARIAAAIDIQRIVYFAEKPGPDGAPAQHVIYEWNAPGIPSHASTNLNVFSNTRAPSFIRPLHEGHPIWSTFDDYQDPLKAAWIPLWVKSTGCVPIFVEGSYHGAITFDDCLAPRIWSETEIATLCSAANAHAAAIERHVFETRAREAENARLAAGRQAEVERREAVLAERTRLAGVIHDTLAQGFVGVLLQLEAAEEARQRGRPVIAEAQTEKARELARFGLSEARRSALAIRPLGAEHDALEKALHNLAERTTIAGRLRCDFTRAGTPRPLPDALAEALLRVANEGLNNALRHGGAERIRIRLKHTNTAVELRLHDNGRWHEPARPDSGLGLRSLRECLAPLGGTLALSTASSGRPGTTLTATLPVPEPATLP